MDNHKWRQENICPHTTNPLQLKKLCKRCRQELEITKRDDKPDWFKKELDDLNAMRGR